jgi:hypothetical protein
MHQNAKPSTFTKYSMCMYEVTNPYPGHTLYLNVYRLTNNSDVGIYYQKSTKAKDSEAHKSRMMPRGSKETLHEYVPGEWKQDVTVPTETFESKGSFHTLKVQYPAREDLFFDMSDHLKKYGGPYHNVSDVMRQYQVDGVDKVNIVVIGQDIHSQFDIGVQVGVFSTG